MQEMNELWKILKIMNFLGYLTFSFLLARKELVERRKWVTCNRQWLWRVAVAMAMAIDSL
jgi:hypothetical protein